MRRFLAFLIVVSLVAPFLFVAPAAAADCEYVLGFRTLHDLIPAQVGTCKTNEYHNPDNGDGLQETAGGLLVWRKADNWTAFTDGYRTWVNGPYGVQQRLNTERFSWEAGGAPSAQPTATPTPLPPVSDHPAGATARCNDGTYSYSQTRQGTCSHHGGVAVWY